MTQVKSSRRNFLKASASLVAVAAPFLLMPQKNRNMMKKLT